jgi:hypothetical protein
MTEPLHLHNFLTFFFNPQVLENWGWGSPHIHDHPTMGLTGDYRRKRKKKKKKKTSCRQIVLIYVKGGIITMKHNIQDIYSLSIYMA